MKNVEKALNETSERLDAVIIDLLETISVDEVKELGRNTRAKLVEVISHYPGKFDDHIYNVLDACLNNERR
ncbi:MAG TPA: hypothetical protein VK190_03340 [Pseudoneobacillus sp.]|jgi:hypothetical protein|nr:hypothetical protein [Pseudoneobacillus sp.]